MIDYELHKITAAELRRRAEAHRTARQAVLARRAARRSRRDDTGRPVKADRNLFKRAA